MLPWPALAPLAAGALVAAAVADPGHDPLADYVSWLADGPYAWLAAAGIAGLAACAAGAALHLRRALAAGPVRDAAVTSLGCAAVLAAATLALPSRGHDEPAWRTVSHVALAVGAYAGVAGAAALLAWRGPRGTRLVPWFGLLCLALLLLGAAAAVARLTSWGVELRGAAQLGLVVAVAGWLAAAAFARPRAQVHGSGRVT